MTGHQQDVLRETLHGMADTASVADGLGDRLAQQAIAVASRRRRIRQGAAAGLAAGAVAGLVLMPVTQRSSDTMHREAPGPPFNAAPARTDTPEASLHATLPTDTQADTQLVTACLKSSGRGPGDDLSRPGDHAVHFRVLSTVNLSNGDLGVFLGSTAGHLVCLLDRNLRTVPPGRATGQVANPWEESFATFRGPLKVDDGGGGVLLVTGGPPSSYQGWELHLAGRVDARVSTMTFTSPGGVTRSAGVNHGFFVWVELGKGNSLPSTDDSVKAKVDLYGADGQELGSLSVDVPAAMFTNPDTTHGGGL